MAFFGGNEDDSEKSKQGMDAMRAMLGPGALDSVIHQAITTCWMMLPDDKKTIDEVERQIRRIVDRALSNLREDADSFGPPGSQQ